MAWLRMDYELLQHPKLQRFARGLGITEAAAAGHLFALWGWAMNYAQDGNLTGFKPDDIAVAAGWPDNAEKFIDAALQCGIRGHGFLEKNSEGDLLLHNWEEHMGGHFKKRKKEAERLRAYRKKKGDTDDERTQYVPSTYDNRNENVRSTYDVRTQYVPSTYAVTGQDMTGQDRQDRQDRQDGDETPPAAAAVEADIGKKPTPQEAKGKSKKSKKDEPPPPTPLPDGPFDMKTFMALQEMYWVAPEYVADPGAEIRLIQELTEEYPAVPLFQEFRKARAWLESHPEKGRKDIRRFLRNWVSKADRQYCTYETVFVPVNEAEGG